MIMGLHAKQRHPRSLTNGTTYQIELQGCLPPRVRLPYTQRKLSDFYDRDCAMIVTVRCRSVVRVQLTSEGPAGPEGLLGQPRAFPGSLRPQPQFPRRGPNVRRHCGWDMRWQPHFALVSLATYSKCRHGMA